MLFTSTDIDVSYDQKKEGRTITHIEFSLNHKASFIISNKILEPTYQLPPKQSLFFAQKLCDLNKYPELLIDGGVVNL